MLGVVPVIWGTSRVFVAVTVWTPGVFKVTEKVLAPLVHTALAMVAVDGRTTAGSVLVKETGPSNATALPCTFTAVTVTLNGVPAVTDDGAVTVR